MHLEDPGAVSLNFFLKTKSKSPETRPGSSWSPQISSSELIENQSEIRLEAPTAISFRFLYQNRLKIKSIQSNLMVLCMNISLFISKELRLGFSTQAYRHCIDHQINDFLYFFIINLMAFLCFETLRRFANSTWRCALGEPGVVLRGGGSVSGPLF